MDVIHFTQDASKRLLLSAAAVLCLLAAVINADAAPQYSPWGLDLTAMDVKAKPGDDFDRYASGAWLARTEIPADKPRFTLRAMMDDTIEARLRELMETAAADSRPASLESKVGAFYTAFMDQSRLQKLGKAAIGGQMAAIRAARDHATLTKLMGQSTTDFYGSIYGFYRDVDLKDVSRYAIYVKQTGLGLPDRDYYLESSYAPQKSAYQAYVAKLLSLLGWKNTQGMAAQVVNFETRIAEASWTKVEQRDLDKTYNPASRAELKALAPAFAWDLFLNAADLSTADRVIVQEKSAFPKIAAVYQSTPLPVLQAWQAFTVADNAAFYMSEAFSAARFQFRDHTLLGQPQEAPRWRRALRAVGGGDCAGDDRLDCFGNLGFAVGEIYTARYFPPESKAKMEALVQNVKAAMRARLERLDWMTPATKQQALAKLDTYQIKVGYPDHPRDFAGLKISANDLIGNVRRAAEWEWRFQISRLKGPVDRSEWIMTPQTDDAYNGSLRDIVFPAGILQPPMFDPEADPAINYGAIGSVIGHELTHGFDDQGRKLDAKGELRDWWTEQDAAEFNARAKKLAAQFSAYEPIPGVHINGDLTLGENIADLGGINIALEAYHRSLHGQPAPVIDGFTGDQRVFLGYAQAWRGKARADFVRRQVVSDEHSPRPYRVLGPIRNVDEWYLAFGIQPKDHYYLDPNQRVRIW
ncbi:MAG TPA: M13 family metallopeptidase [Steroidobacteraceae bacterium]|nr:M13 family metallopeptidase [Steroidobacteraceae bacterium]